LKNARKRLSNFFKKVCIIFNHRVVFSINMQEMLKAYFEGKLFVDNSGYTVTARDGELYYTKDGETWTKSDSWSIISTPNGRIHLAYSSKNHAYPNMSDIYYDEIDESNDIKRHSKLSGRDTQL
jgi:hypothetical protein